MKRALIAAAAALLAAACSPEQEEGSPCGPTSGEVVTVVDGDTIQLASGEKIRYLLVDTPEVTMGHNDCYGAEAKSFNASLVLGSVVDIAYGTECTDMYGRLLAVVSVEGREVNSLLLERGYAKVLFINGNGADRKAEYDALVAKAKAAGAGGWGACEDSEWWY